ncbi:hypothetical protein [Nocardiopsis aegyptia]|uniref:Uncharacterized protein n=1 Tax=Nocardiopsis aegyptia TaxID=220378 RepID=A0A7Z0EVP5_9ACTN|nr:hypothetical protein [Nocardiopsis aegyptia]NYJ38170.1 hypothetical protein [Nocardiopsis aegyptia]
MGHEVVGRHGQAPVLVVAVQRPPQRQIGADEPRVGELLALARDPVRHPPRRVRSQGDPALAFGTDDPLVHSARAQVVEVPDHLRRQYQAIAGGEAGDLLPVPSAPADLCPQAFVDVRDGGELFLVGPQQFPYACQRDPGPARVRILMRSTTASPPYLR